MAEHAEPTTQSVFDYIKSEEATYNTMPIPLADGWEWNMHEHIRRSFLYLNSKFSQGENDGERPYKNIIVPIINVAKRTEGFDVKDIVPFVAETMNSY